MYMNIYHNIQICLVSSLHFLYLTNSVIILIILKTPNIDILVIEIQNMIQIAHQRTSIMHLSSCYHRMTHNGLMQTKPLLQPTCQFGHQVHLQLYQTTWGRGPGWGFPNQMRCMWTQWCHLLAACVTRLVAWCSVLDLTPCKAKTERLRLESC